MASASDVAKASAKARNCEFDPNAKSTRLAVHFTAPVVRSRPSNRVSSSEMSDQVVPMSNRFVKKSLLRLPGRSVKTP